MVSSKVVCLRDHKDPNCPCCEVGHVLVPRALIQPLPVLTKTDFVRRFQAGEFGNRGPVWDTVQEFLNLDERPHGLLHLRNRIAGGPTWYNLTYQELIAKCQELGDVTNYYVALMAPTEKTLIQGELLRTPQGLNLFYSRIAKPMRDALREKSESIQGIIAKELCRYFMDPSSYDWCMELLDLYPDHVVEFSVYACCWGTIPNRNTVIWEVRGGY